MAEWAEVRAAMASGRRLPIRGRVTAHRHSRFSVGYAAGSPLMLVFLHPQGLDLHRAQGQLRLDRVDGTPHFISTGARAWYFAEDPERPVTTESRFARIVGPGYEVVAASDGVEQGIEQGFPSGPVQRSTHLGRPVWVIPGTVDGVAAQLTVDQATGVVVAVAAVDGDWSAQFTAIEFPESIDPAMFGWDGPSTEAPPVEFIDRGDGTWTVDELSAVTAAEPCVGRRVYPVQIPLWLIEDGSVTPPRVGDTVHWPLLFSTDNEGRPEVESAVVTILAEATPVKDGNPEVDSTRTRRWSTHLQGDGWFAAWAAERPVVGTVSVRGFLWLDALGQAVFGTDLMHTRGRVCRIQVKLQRQRRVQTAMRTRWEDVADSARWIDVQACPHVFGLPERSKVLPDGSREYPVDVVVHLDLDTAQPPTPRPRLVAGSSAVSGRTLWVADEQLPVVARLDLDLAAPAVQTVLPLPVATSHPTTQHHLSVYPDTQGCWVLTRDHRYRIDQHSPEAVLDTEPLGEWSACAYDGHVMLILGQRSTLIHPDGRRIALDLPKWDSIPVIAQRRSSDPRFVVALRKADVPMRPNRYGGADAQYIYRLVTISDTGDVTVGPDVEFTSRVDAVGIVDGQIWVVTQSAIHTFADDLTPHTVLNASRLGLEAGFVQNQLWILAHHRSAAASSGGWTNRDGETTFSDEDGFGLFGLLDLPSLEPAVAMAVNSNYLRVTADADGTVWGPGREIRGLHPDGTVTRIDIADFLREEGA